MHLGFRAWGGLGLKGWVFLELGAFRICGRYHMHPGFSEFNQPRNGGSVVGVSLVGQLQDNHKKCYLVYLKLVK